MDFTHQFSRGCRFVCVFFFNNLRNGREVKYANECFLPAKINERVHKFAQPRKKKKKFEPTPLHWSTLKKRASEKNYINGCSGFFHHTCCLDLDCWRVNIYFAVATRTCILQCQQFNTRHTGSR